MRNTKNLVIYFSRYDRGKINLNQINIRKKIPDG